MRFHLSDEAIENLCIGVTVASAALIGTLFFLASMYLLANA